MKLYSYKMREKPGCILPDGSIQMIELPVAVEATPSDISAAHPKCGTCRQYGRITDDGDPTLIEHVCDWDVLAIEDPATDYCPCHSELQ